MNAASLPESTALAGSAPAGTPAGMPTGVNATAAGPAPVTAVRQRLQQAHAADLLPGHAVRAERLRRLQALVDTDGPALAQAISEDFGGRSLTEIRITEVMVLQAGLRDALRHLARWMRPRRVGVALAHRPGRARLMPQPLGVVGIVSPWNYPLLLSLGPLTGVLAAGNRAVLKPSELTPRFSDALVQAVARHFSPDEVAVVTGDADVGRAFVDQPWDHLVFTGSTAVGRQVAQAAARHLTPVTLELGGKSPVIIDASCPLSPVLMDRLAWGKLINAGQTCIAPDYLLVPRAQQAALVEALQAAMRRLYPRFQGNPDYTSIISERHRQRLAGLVDSARAQGARVIELEAASTLAIGRQMAPVLLQDVRDDMPVMQEEIFGPLLPIVPYDTLEQALAIVNRRDRPLALYWFGEDAAARERVLAGSLSGGVSINDTLLHIAQDGLPFGGVGPSGMGHYHGEHGFRQFSKDKPVFLQSRWSGGGLIRPPYGPGIGRLLNWLGKLL